MYFKYVKNENNNLKVIVVLEIYYWDLKEFQTISTVHNAAHRNNGIRE